MCVSISRTYNIAECIVVGSLCECHPRDYQNDCYRPALVLLKSELVLQSYVCTYVHTYIICRFRKVNVFLLAGNQFNESRIFIGNRREV